MQLGYFSGAKPTRVSRVNINMAKNNIKRWLLHADKIYYGVVWIFDESVIMSTHDKRQTIIHLDKEMPKALEALSKAGIEVQKASVDDKQLLQMMDITP